MNFARLKLPLLLRLGILFLPLADVALGQQAMPFVVEPPPNAVYPDFGPGNFAAARLRRQPAKMFTFDRAALRDVLRYLADDAGIPFIGIPESDAANRILVTLTMEASPFIVLESVCRDNGVRLSYENGVWYMRALDEKLEKQLLLDAQIKEDQANRLINMVYHLNYDPVDRVDFKTADPTASILQTSATSIPLQNSQRIFQNKEPRIVNEIRSLLGLPDIVYDKEGKPIPQQLAKATTRDSRAQGGVDMDSSTSSEYQGNSSKSNSNTKLSGGYNNSTVWTSNVYVPPQGPQVVYSSDTNNLWVVATKAQHEWIVDYLRAVDVPQDLIAIEVKFFETAKDPSKAYGINWANTFGGNGLTFRGSAQASGSGGVTVTTQNGNNANNGFNNSSQFQNASQVGTGPQTVSANGTVAPGQPPYNYTLGAQNNSSFNNQNNFSGKSYNATFNAPYSAVLSMDEVAVSIKAFMQDTGTTVVQYPRVLTVNNREVAISSAVNTPILSSSQTTGNAGSSTSTQQINYFPIGTQINILPKTVGKEEIAMSVAITISTYVSDKSIAGNLYPVTASRVYNAALQVTQGYTLAVGGLETTDDRASSDGIPVMRDIPVVGQFFKSKGRARNKKNLIIFITPMAIKNTKTTRGISETPESVIPVRPNDPTPPAFTPDGQLVGGHDAINAAFAWFDFQVKWFKQVNKENRTDRESIKQLRAVIASARMLVRDIARMQESADPAREDELARLEQRAVATLTELNRVLSVAQNNLM